jgi:predicted ATPase
LPKETLLAREPDNEHAIQHLLFCLAAGGEPERALLRFKALQAQADFPFSRETLALVQNIRDRADVAAPARRTNLPRPLTSFIGREDELNAIETLLTRSRLVTLLGAGGSGKTRLAIQAADEVAHQYEGGVWWVDLSALAEPERVPQSIARALGVQERLNHPLLELTAEFIGGQTMLLVVDNCEHLIQACAAAVDFLLAACHGLTVLATSREPLGVSGETGWQAPTLAVPAGAGDPKVLRRNEAVRLFTERGFSADHNFQLTEHNAQHVVTICRRLDGIPLAIELAAAMLRTLPVAQLAQHIERQFARLHLEDARRVPRQQTLRALIGWSHDQLTTTEQIFFRRLGIFSGGWTFESAVVVGGGYEPAAIQQDFLADGSPASLPINPADVVLGLLDSLRRRSLLTLRHVGERSRYGMLETIREFALAELAASGELPQTRACHLAETLRQASQLRDQTPPGVERAVWRARYEAELDNVRAALEWSLEAGDLDHGLQLASAVYAFWTGHGYKNEVRSWMPRLLAHPQAQPPTAHRAYVLAQCALALRNLPERARGIPMTAEAAQIFQSLGEERGLAYAHYAMGEVLFNNGDLEAARLPLLAAVSYYRAQGEPHLTFSSALSALGRISLGLRRFEEAYAYTEEALALAEQMGNASAAAWSRLVLGDLAYRQDQPDLAARHYEESLAAYRVLKRPGNIAYLLEILATIAFWRGELEQAARLLEGCFEQYERTGGFTALSRGYQAAIALAGGDLAAARASLELAFSPLNRVDPEYHAVGLLKLADYAAALGRTETAVSLYLLVIRLDADPVVILLPPDRRAAHQGLDSARARLSPEAFQAAQGLADSLTFEAAVRLFFPQL